VTLRALPAPEPSAATATAGAPVAPPPSPGRSIVPAIVLGGVAVVGVGVSVGLLAAAGGEGSTVEDLSGSIGDAGRSCVAGAGNFDPRCAELEDTAGQADALQNAGVAVLVGAGVAAAAAGAYLLWWPTPAAAARAGIRVRAVPAVSATGSPGSAPNAGTASSPKIRRHGRGAEGAGGDRLLRRHERGERGAR
jgi:hypothetical protein